MEQPEIPLIISFHSCLALPLEMMSCSARRQSCRVTPWQKRSSLKTLSNSSSSVMPYYVPSRVLIASAGALRRPFARTSGNAKRQSMLVSSGSPLHCRPHHTLEIINKVKHAQYVSLAIASAGCKFRKFNPCVLEHALIQ